MRWLPIGFVVMVLLGATARVDAEEQTTCGALLQVCDDAVITPCVGCLLDTSLTTLPETLAVEAVRIDTARLDAVRVEVGRGGTDTRVTLGLSDDVAHEIRFEHVAPTVSGYALSGTVISTDGLEIGSAAVAVNGDVVAGTVRVAHATYDIRPTALDGIHAVATIDPTGLPPAASRISPMATRVDEAAPVAVTPDAATPSDQYEDGSMVDLVVAYTPAARRTVGGEQAIRTLIDLMVAEANVAYRVSGIVQRLHLVRTVEADYLEQGAMTDDLRALIAPSDNKLDALHAMRTRHGADLLHLLVDRREGGTFRTVALGEHSPELEVVDDALAFSVSDPRGGGMALTQATAVPFGVAIGDQSIAPMVAGMAQGYVNAGAFVGEPDPRARWRTLMTTDAACQAAGFACQHLLRFANAEQRFRGAPVGVAEIDPVTGHPRPARDRVDVRMRLNQVRHAVANFRVSPALGSDQIVSLQANNGNYLGAVGAAVTADRTAAGVTERLRVIALDADGILRSGTPVTLQTSDGFYLRATQGGGAGLDAASTAAGPWERFTVHRVLHGELVAGVIRSGDGVAIRTENGHFVVAEQGGSQVVSADRLGVGLWETFRIAVDPEQPMLNAVIDLVPSRQPVDVPVRVPVDEPVIFSAARSTGHIREMTWMLGDGTHASGVRLVHVFPAALLHGETSASIPVELALEDEHGNVDTATVHVEIFGADGTAEPRRRLSAEFRVLDPQNAPVHACALNPLQPNEARCQFDATISTTDHLTTRWRWQVADTLSPLHLGRRPTRRPAHLRVSHWGAGRPARPAGRRAPHRGGSRRRRRDPRARGRGLRHAVRPGRRRPRNAARRVTAAGTRAPGAPNRAGTRAAAGLLTATATRRSVRTRTNCVLSRVGSAAATAARVTGPSTPSRRTPRASCKSRMARRGPESAASSTSCVRTGPAGRVSNPGARTNRR